MPKFFTKPLVTWTKAQWREVLKRAFEKKGILTPKTAEALMKYEPPVSREMGTLYKNIPVGGGEAIRRPERLPIAEARAKYFANPEEYITPGVAEPSAKEMAMLPPPSSPLGASEMAKRVAYERLDFKPIIPAGTQQAAGVIRKEVGTAAAEVPPVAEVVQTALIGDSLWKGIGGTRSVAGKRWQELLDSSRGAVKSHFTTGRDYFISSYYRWKQDPSKFRKNYPRESKLLEEAQKAFEESVGPGVE